MEGVEHWTINYTEPKYLSISTISNSLSQILLLNLDCLVPSSSVQTFKQIIVIYRKGNYILHH